MATLTRLTLDADGTIDTANIEHDGGTGSPYFSHCNDAPDGVSSDFVQNDDGETSGFAWFSLSNVNADFGSMATLNIDVDVQAVGFSNDTCTLTARVFAADDDTANPLTAETGNLGTDLDSSRVQRNVVFGTLAGTKAQWDAAHIRFTWTYAKSGGPDNANLQLFGCDIDGTYAVAAPAVTAVGDGSEPDKKQNVVITGTNFGASDTGSAQVEITDNATYGAGTFEIIVPRDSWTATSIQVDLQETGTGNPLLDDLTAGTVWCYVTDSAGSRSPGFAFILKEQGATWIAAKNIDWTQDVDVNFRVRIEIKNTSGSATTPAFKWQYNHEAGGWNDITASSSVVQTAASAHFADGDDLTEQLLGSDTFVANNNAAEESTGTFTMGANLATNEVIETEACLTIISGDVVDADTIDLRIVESDGTALGTYTQTPTITVNEVGGHTSTGAPEFEIMTMVALGRAGADGAGVLTLGAQEMVAVGVEKFVGTGAPTLEPESLVAAGVGGAAGTGALDLAIQEMVAAGVLKFVGTGAPNFEIQELVAAGVDKFVGTGAPTLEPESLVAAGVGGEVGTGALDLAIQELVAAGVLKFVGTGAPTLEPESLVAAGVGGADGAGTLNITTQELVAAGVEKFVGTGAPNFEIQELVAAGTAGAPGVGTGAPSLETLELAALGAAGAVGAGVLNLEPDVLVAAGVLKFVGTGAPTLEPESLTAAGGEEAIGVGALNITTQELVAAGVGGEVGVGAPNLEPDVMVAAGTMIASSFEGTGNLVLNIQELAAIGLMEADGVGVLDLADQLLATVGKSSFPGIATLLLAQAMPGSATETQRPNGELSDSGLVANSELDHDEDPDSVSVTINATANNVNTEWGGDFPTPTGNPRAGAGLQEFRVGVEEFDSGQTGIPTARIELWENGSLVRAGSNTNVEAYAVLSFAWNANELATADGSLVQCKLIGTAIGGNPSIRNSVRIGHMEWNVDYETGGGGVTDIFVTATGKQVFVSTASPELQPETLVAAGLEKFVSSAALDLAIQELATAGVQEFISTGAPDLADFSLVAIGLGSTTVSVGAPELEDLTIVAVGQMKPSGIGDVALAALALVAAGSTDTVAAVGVYRPIMRPRRR